MANTRILLSDFSLANPLYSGSAVFVYTVDPTTFIPTTTLATLYDGLTGSGVLGNPAKLDTEGKWQNPPYVDVNIVMVVKNSLLDDHQTGVTGPVNISGPTAFIIATNSTTARTLSDRAASVRDVLDFGANPNGTSAAADSLAAFSAAQNTAQAAGGGSVYVPYGTYWLSGSVYSVDTVTFEIAPGVTFNGPGTILGMNDTPVGNFGRIVSKFTNTTQGLFGFYSTMLVVATTGNVAYEKAAIFGRIKTGDASIVGFDKDSVAIQGIAEIATGNLNGRIWAGDFLVFAPNGSDGYIKGIEIGINNNASAQPLVDQPTSKIGIDAIASGSLNSTAAYVVSTSGEGFYSSTGIGKWETGVFIKDTAINTNAISLNTQFGGGWKSIFSIDKYGSGIFANVDVYGALSVHGSSHITAALNVDGNTALGGNSIVNGLASFSSTRIGQVISGFSGSQIQTQLGLSSTNKMSVGWNYSNGRGEIDLLVNRNAGAEGGLRIYDFVTGTYGMTLMLDVDAVGNMAIPKSIVAGKGIGFFGVTPPSIQPSAPVTLADVIALVRGCGISA